MKVENNPYDVLEVESTASQEEIHAAFRKQALKWHPDKNPKNQEEAVRRFQDIEEAYRFLSDKDQRARYDDLGEQFENEMQIAAVSLLMSLEMKLLDHPESVDHVYAINDMLKQAVRNQKNLILQNKMVIRKVEGLAKRWARKKGGRNVFANMYARRIKEGKEIIKEAEKAIEISETAARILHDYEFKYEGMAESAGYEIKSITFRTY